LLERVFHFDAWIVVKLNFKIIKTSEFSLNPRELMFKSLGNNDFIIILSKPLKNRISIPVGGNSNFLPRE